jgi:hypothetical protein
VSRVSIKPTTRDDATTLLFDFFCLTFSFRRRVLSPRRAGRANSASARETVMVPSVACSGHGDVAIVPMLNPAAVTVADIFCADAKRERGGADPVSRKPGNDARPRGGVHFVRCQRSDVRKIL